MAGKLKLRSARGLKGRWSAPHPVRVLLLLPLRCCYLRADGSGDSERSLPREGVHVLRDLDVVAHQQARDAARGLDDLQTSKNVSLGICERLALLGDDGASDLVVVLSNECLEPGRRRPRWREGCSAHRAEEAPRD